MTPLNILIHIKLVLLVFQNFESYSLKMISMWLISNFTIFFMDLGEDVIEISTLKFSARISILLNLVSTLHTRTNLNNKGSSNMPIEVGRKKKSWEGLEFKLKGYSINFKKLRERSKLNLKDNSNLKIEWVLRW